MRVVIIGGGASGLVAAIYAANNNNRVILIDKNSNFGKKILVTGNGKCNYWNKDISLKHYHSNNLDVLDKIITDKNKIEIENFFKRIGIVPRIKDNYYYPYSNQASSIQTALIKEAYLRKVEFINNCEVLDVIKEDDKFKVVTDKQILVCDKVIISTGTKASNKNLTSNLGYEVARKFNHQIIKPLPALVQIKLNETYLKEWHGIRSDVLVKMYEDNKFIKEEVGEIQLTDYGVSGICILQLSSLISRGLYNKKKEQIEINFLNSLGINNSDDFIRFMDDRNKLVISRSISELLDGILNYKLVNLFLKRSKIDRDLLWDEIDFNKKYELGKMLTGLRVMVSGTNDFDCAQVCSGGIMLREINPDNMESLLVKGLYFTGEVLDVDGECGGFNLGFAWISGYLAGKSIGGNND